jgi:hypothetical protein
MGIKKETARRAVATEERKKDNGPQGRGYTSSTIDGDDLALVGPIFSSLDQARA